MQPSGGAPTLTLGRPGEARLLLVEDDLVLRDLIGPSIERAGYGLTAVADGLEAVGALRSRAFDLVLLDIELPLVDGWQVMARLAGQLLPAVVVISARGDERDKVRALDMGADDYLAKPFGTPELLSRIRAVLRRSVPSTVTSEAVECAGLRVDFRRRTVFRDGKEIRLSPTEYLLIAVLAKHAGRICDRRGLLREVWGPEYVDEWSYLRTFAKTLRAKVERDPAQPEVIVTVHGRGYRFGPALQGGDRPG